MLLKNQSIINLLYLIISELEEFIDEKMVIRA